MDHQAILDNILVELKSSDGGRSLLKRVDIACAIIDLNNSIPESKIDWSLGYLQDEKEFMRSLQTGIFHIGARTNIECHNHVGTTILIEFCSSFSTYYKVLHKLLYHLSGDEKVRSRLDEFETNKSNDDSFNEMVYIIENESLYISNTQLIVSEIKKFCSRDIMSKIETINKLLGVPETPNAPDPPIIP